MWTLSRHQSKLIFRKSRSQLELLVRERTEALQSLSQRLLRVQDEERRRLARDLHDSAGQILTALKMSAALLQTRLDDGERIREELSGIESLADEALQEIRTTSYLLHPPMLDEAGFTSAAQWYVDGFAKRSGLKVRIDFAPQVERLPDTVETALFRVLQESLTNVYRHSESSEVEVRFLREAHVVILEVRDYGRGIPEKLLRRLGQSVQDPGVGLAGMCERLNELKGDLEITSADPGTRLRAIVPLCPVPQEEEVLNDRVSVQAAATNRAIYRACKTFVIRAKKLPSLTRSVWAGLDPAKRIPLNMGPWKTALSLTAVLVIACWVGFRDSRPLSSSGVSRLHSSSALEPLLVSAKRVVADGTSKAQISPRRELVERHASRTHLPQVPHKNIRVRYLSDDVTVRYFFPQSPLQWVRDRDIRVWHISDDVTVRYFSPESAVASPLTPDRRPAQSVSR